LAAAPDLGHVARLKNHRIKRHLAHRLPPDPRSSVTMPPKAMARIGFVPRQFHPPPSFPPQKSTFPPAHWLRSEQRTHCAPHSFDIRTSSFVISSMASFPKTNPP